MSVEQNIRLARTPLMTGPTLQYAQQGDRSGEPIIFLHGYSDSWFSFSRVLPLLSSEYHAFALTQRGHGDSDKPECCYTLDDFAADVDAFMEAVSIEEATLVGMSGGSFIAQRVALDYPHRVSRLVLISSAVTLRDNEAVMGLVEEMLALEDPISPEFVREWQEVNVYHPVPDEFFATVVSESLKLPARVWRDYWEGWCLNPIMLAGLARSTRQRWSCGGAGRRLLARRPRAACGSHPRCHIEGVPRDRPLGALGAPRGGRAGLGGVHERGTPRPIIL